MEISRQAQKESSRSGHNFQSADLSLNGNHPIRAYGYQLIKAKMDISISGPATVEIR
jgi:hypothetical protein